MRTATRTARYNAGTGAKVRARIRYPWHRLVGPGDWFLWKLGKDDRAQEMSLRANAYKQRDRRGLALSCERTPKGLIVTVVQKIR